MTFIHWNDDDQFIKLFRYLNAIMRPYRFIGARRCAWRLEATESSCARLTFAIHAPITIQYHRQNRMQICVYLVIWFSCSAHRAVNRNTHIACIVLTFSFSFARRRKWKWYKPPHKTRSCLHSQTFIFILAATTTSLSYCHALPIGITVDEMITGNEHFST